MGSSYLPAVAWRRAGRLACLLLACTLLGCAPARIDTSGLHSDDAREQRWADEIVPALVVGDAVWLQPPGPQKKFLGLYTQPKQGAKAARGAIVLVHGLGVNPDYGVIGSLRTSLADAGWTTLSIQMPVLAAGEPAERYPGLFSEASDRIGAAVAWLQERKYKRIVLVSHSMGSRMSNFFLTRSPDNGIAAWASIGISSGEFADPAKLRLPVLDIYGERDFPQVLKNADARAATLKLLKGSAQIEVAGADHYFAGSEHELVRQVRQFLDQKFK